MVEHLTADQEVPGSNPSAPFVLSYSKSVLLYCYPSSQQVKHFFPLLSTDKLKKITGIFFYFEKTLFKGGIAQW